MQVNNYFYDISGHAFEIGEGGYVLAEGNVFQNVDTVLETYEGAAFTVPSTTAGEVCSTYLGRDCVINGFGSSGTFSEDSTSFLSDFEGKNIASASAYTSVASSVVANAGQGNL